MAIIQKLTGAAKYYLNVGKCLLVDRVLKPSAAPLQVEIDISKHVYHRYLYLLAKLFLLSGYVVYIKPRLSSIRTIRTCTYSRLLFETKGIYFGRAPSPSLILTDNQFRFNALKGPKKLVSPEYFSAKKGSTQHLIPICLHPLMYHNGYWDAPVKVSKRINAVILYGNFESDLYRAITNDQLFRSANRVDIKKQLEALDNTVLVTNLDTFDSADLEGKIVIIDSNILPIPQSELRSVLSKFRYFIAIPGVFMPPCHNIMETLSVGCVPIMEYEYIDWLNAPLINDKSVLCFEGLSELNQRLVSALSKTADEWESLSLQAGQVYKEYFTPESIVKNIVDTPLSTVALLSGQYALKALNEEKRSNTSI